MPAVVSRSITHTRFDAAGKPVETVVFAKGDRVHDDALHDELKSNGHANSLAPVEHTASHCPDDCKDAFPSAPAGKSFTPPPSPPPATVKPPEATA